MEVRSGAEFYRLGDDEARYPFAVLLFLRASV